LLKLKSLKYLCLLFLVVATSAGCRYKDGPVVSLKSPESRLFNKWTVADDDFNARPSNTYGQYWDIRTDSTVMVDVNGNLATYKSDLSDDKKGLTVEQDNGITLNGDKVTYKILKLTNRKLRLGVQLSFLTFEINFVR